MKPKPVNGSNFAPNKDIEKVIQGVHEAVAQASSFRCKHTGYFVTEGRYEGYFAPYTTAQQQNAKETGYDLSRNLYRPHITLTRYVEGGMPEIFPGIPEANLSFGVERIGVYKADDNGAVYERLQEFPL